MGYPGPGTIWNFPGSQNPKIMEYCYHITIFFDKNKETNESSGISLWYNLFPKFM